MTEPSEKTTALVQLAGAVAHELNNIFTAVTGNLSLLDHGFADAADRDAIVRDVVHAAQRGIDLTSKLQAFAGRQYLNRKSVDLNALVLRIIRDLRPMLANARIGVSLTDMSLMVHADEQKLSDMLIELVRNAHAALPATGGCIVVETLWSGVNQCRPCAHLRVRDNGKGMAPEVAARATEPLFTTRPEGIKAGWGLSNCAGFVRQLGGRLSISSEEGSGTLVEINLPLDDSASGKPGADMLLA